MVRVVSAGDRGVLSGADVRGVPGDHGPAPAAHARPEGGGAGLALLAAEPRERQPERSPKKDHD